MGESTLCIPHPFWQRFPKWRSSEEIGKVFAGLQRFRYQKTPTPALAPGLGHAT
jgi:hypothetical protein